MNWNAFRFQNPGWLLLLLAIVGAWWLARKLNRRSTLLYSSVSDVRDLPVTLRQRCKRVLPWLRWLALALVVIALARPQLGREDFRVRTEGIAIQMCIDKSGSMEAMDFEIDEQRVTRLEIVKDVFRRFVAGDGDLPGRGNDQIGLIAFGGFADALVPLTLDHTALQEILATVEIPGQVLDERGRVLNEQLLQQEQATAIGDALTLAVDRLRNVESKSKIIILLSDGENTAGVVEPIDAAEIAKTYGIRIYSIGVGTTGLAPYPDIDFTGRKILNPVSVRLDEATLKEVARITDGEYFNAQTTEALEDVYKRIDVLEKTVTEGILYEEYTELFQWLLIAAFLLVALEVVLANTWLRSLP